MVGSKLMSQPAKMDKQTETHRPYVYSINISPGGIPKLPVESVQVTFLGLAGDGHNHEKHRTPLQAVSLQDIERLEEFHLEGYSLSAGATGENLTVRHLDVNSLPIGTVLEFSGGVVLELTKVRKPCYVLDAIDPQLKEAMTGRCGLYAKVLKEGFVQREEKIYVRQPAGQ